MFGAIILNEPRFLRTRARLNRGLEGSWALLVLYLCLFLFFALRRDYLAAVVAVDYVAGFADCVAATCLGDDVGATALLTPIFGASCAGGLLGDGLSTDCHGLHQSGCVGRT